MRYKKTAKFLATCAALGCFAVTGVTADDEKSVEEAKEPTKLEKAMAKYEKTGETKRCISPAYIRDSNVVDDNHIIFRWSSKKAYLNTLKRKCHSLDFHESIAYTVRGGQICRGDIFRVINGTNMGGSVCSFGDFEVLKRKEKPQEDTQTGE